MAESRSRWQWQPELKFWVLAALLVPVLLGLGAWQLDRAAQKSAQAALWEERDNPVEWPPESRETGQPVELRGHYDPDVIWMLDNRTRDGQRGYELLHLFHTSSGPVVVNRGWIAAPGDRDSLPGISSPEESVTIRARIAEWPEPMVLGDVDPVNPEGWPRRVARLTLEKARAVDERIDAVPVRIADDEPGALETGWDSERMGAATHYGYAAQWFALAVLLLTLTIAVSFRKHEDD